MTPKRISTTRCNTRRKTRNGRGRSEGAARAVATALIARLRNQAAPVTHAGKGTCYIEFGAGRIGAVDVDFFSNPDGPTGTYYEPSVALRADKEHFGSSRRARWFGLSQ